MLLEGNKEARKDAADSPALSCMSRGPARRFSHMHLEKGRQRRKAAGVGMQALRIHSNTGNAVQRHSWQRRSMSAARQHVRACGSGGDARDRCPALPRPPLSGSAEMRETEVLSMRGGPNMVPSVAEPTLQQPWAGVGLPRVRLFIISFCTLRSSRYTCNAGNQACQEGQPAKHLISFKSPSPHPCIHACSGCTMLSVRVQHA